MGSLRGNERQSDIRVWDYRMNQNNGLIDDVKVLNEEQRTVGFFNK